MTTSNGGEDLLQSVLHLSARESVQEWVTAARANLSRLNTQGDGAEDPSIVYHREQLQWWVDLLDRGPGEYREVLRDLRDRKAILTQEKAELTANAQSLRAQTRMRIHVHRQVGGADGREAAKFERSVLDFKLAQIAQEKVDIEEEVGRIKMAIIVLRRLAGR